MYINLFEIINQHNFPDRRFLSRINKRMQVLWPAEPGDGLSAFVLAMTSMGMEIVID